MLFTLLARAIGPKRRFDAWAKYHDVSLKEIRVMISRSAVDYRDERAAKELENELLKAKGKGFPQFYL